VEQAIGLRGIVAVVLRSAGCAWAEATPEKMASVEYLVGT
jgi:hypothetical protein